MKIQIKKLSSDATIPTKGTIYSAGMDLYSCIEKPLAVAPKSTVKVSTGLSIAVPVGYAGFIYARSGLATKQGLRPSNCVGVIDSDYRGEIVVALYNDSDEIRTVNHGDRIAQLVVAPVTSVDWNIVNELEDTERGSGGFGSTGVK